MWLFVVLLLTMVLTLFEVFIRAVPDVLLGNPAGARFVKKIRPEPDIVI